MSDAKMQFLGSCDGVNWYWAEPGKFENPGVYFWNGKENVLCTMPEGEWAIDHSAGRPILTYKNCSVIEAEEAEFVLALIAQNKAAAGIKWEAE